MLEWTPTDSMTRLEEAVTKIVMDRGEDWKEFLNDVLSTGCISGTVSELTYIADTKDFYEEHKDDINALLAQLLDDLGAKSPVDIFGEEKFDTGDPVCLGDNNRNLLAWFGFEEVCRQMADYLEI